MLGLLGDVLPVALVKVKLAAHDELKEGGVRLVVKGRVAAQENKEDDAERPDVNLLAVPALHEDLWGDVVWGAARGLERDVVVEELCEAKVCDKDVRLRAPVAEEEVLWLEVAVDNAVLVEVLDGFCHLLCDAACVGLGKVSLVDNAVKQLAARDVVQHEVQLVRGVKALAHAHNVLVLDLFEDADLGLDHVFLSRAEGLVDDFAGVLLLCASVFCQPHDGKVACAELLPKLVSAFHVTLLFVRVCECECECV